MTIVRQNRLLKYVGITEWYWCSCAPWGLEFSNNFSSFKPYLNINSGSTLVLSVFVLELKFVDNIVSHEGSNKFKFDGVGDDIQNIVTYNRILCVK